MSLHVVILAGGRGERFWPLSRRLRPKQLLPLVGDRSLLEATIARVASRVESSHRWIAAAVDLGPSLDQIPLDIPRDHFLWETTGRNTAPALGAAAESILAGGGGALVVLPSDHWIPDTEEFWRSVKVAETLLAEHPERVVTLGITPSYPETGYGYIERDEALPLPRSAPTGLHAYRVRRFHEKPSVDRAEAYLAGGRCYWNSGIFLFDAAGVARLLRRHCPDMAPPLDRLRDALSRGVTAEEWSAYYQACPSISIDYALAERAEDVAVVEAPFAWSDLGSWPAWGDQQPVDARGNRVRGPVLAQDSADCLLYSEDGGLLAVLGIEKMIVVRVGDATLVCAKDRAQEIRRLVEEGKLDARFARHF
ncbi:MAG: mannose-1-phosphate guanylyltransferase [Candidatus Eisenbacteria bacterium]|nr:mannose-1-phosphate guanylyltransferase [Candidatus Eisenbacteria bacterium]MCC7143120.1 mannose-1-phosphate guanylyltransferase [Candidatus Eisenbacteria bacterium]